MSVIFIAGRNMIRNKRRTTLNAISLAIGTCIMIFGIGWIRGYIDGIYERMINFETGHIQIIHPDYEENSRRLPLDLNIENPEELSQTIMGIDHVVQVSPRLDFSVKLSFKGKSTHLLSRGIDFEKEAQITEVKDNIVSGNYSEGLLIGSSLADKMGIKAGDTVFISTRDRYQNQNLIDIPVSGIFNFGYDPLDNNMVYLPIKTADNLLGMNGEVSRLVVKLDNTSYLNESLSQIRKQLQETNYTIDPWKSFARIMVTAIEADMGGFYLIIAIIYLLIFLGILNSMSMAVQERVSEIGTMRALGMKKRTLISLFVWEGLGNGIFSSIIGILIAIPFVLYIHYIGLNIEGLMPTDMPIPFGTVMKGDYLARDFIISALITTAAAGLGSIIPAIRAGRLTINQTLSSHLG